MSDTLVAVLTAEVDLDVLPQATPARLRQVLLACLRKDPKQRVRDIADVRLAMEGAFETAPPPPVITDAAPALQVWQRPVPALIAALLVASISLVVWSLTRPPDTRPDLVRSTVATSASAPLGTRNLPDIAISPDGTTVVYGGPRPGGIGFQLYRRPIDQLDGALLRGTEGGAGPFFSPNGEWIGFQPVSSLELRRVSIGGGAPVTLATLPSEARGASWGSDDQIILGTVTEGLFRVPASGGRARETDHPGC